MMKYLSALLIVVFLVSCASKPPPALKGEPALSADQMDPGRFPQDYQIRIISWLRMNAEDPDRVRIVSIEAPKPKKAEASVPEKDIRKGEAVWESWVVTEGFRGDSSGPSHHRFYFKDGVIRTVDLK